MSLIKNDELDAILSDLKLAWETLAAVAMQAPGAAEIVGPRSKVPVVIDMVFEQAKANASATGLTKDERAELERLRSAPYYWAQNNGAILEDSDRYRWLRDNCARARQEEIIEAADGKADMLDHHIDKGRCGL